MAHQMIMENFIVVDRKHFLSINFDCTAFQPEKPVNTIAGIYIVINWIFGVIGNDIYTIFESSMLAKPQELYGNLE